MGERSDLLDWTIVWLLREPESFLLRLVSRFGFAEFVVCHGEKERERVLAQVRKYSRRDN